MIVVDFDSLEDNQKARDIVTKMICHSIMPLPNMEKLEYAPTQAFVWFSKKVLTKKILERENLPSMGASFITGKNILEGMKFILKDINQFCTKNQMGRFLYFKNTTVITNSHMLEIQQMGADVTLISMFGEN